jgi:hypothetical protein
MMGIERATLHPDASPQEKIIFIFLAVNENTTRLTWLVKII